MAKKRKTPDRPKTPAARLTAVEMLFFASAFLLLGLRDLALPAFLLAAAVPGMLWLGVHALPRLFPADQLLLSHVNCLCALGVLVLYAGSPALAYKQLGFYGAGLAAMAACVYLIRWVRSWRGLVWLLMPLSLALLLTPLLFGREVNGAINWIMVGGVSVQPSELVKLSLLIVVSWHMSRHQLFGWLVFAVACLALLMLQRDLGTALLYYGVTVLMYFAASGSLLVTGVGLGGGVGAAMLGYRMFAHVKRRVAIWQNPWSDYDNAGYQIIQGLMALASGGLIGVGLGLGSPASIPVWETDFIFAVICEQFGWVFGLCVLAMYAAIIWRGVTIASAARRSFHALLAMGATLMLGLQAFVIIGGVLKLIPLTGVTLPFVSSGGSSLISSMCLIGLLQGVASLTDDDLARDERLAKK